MKRIIFLCTFFILATLNLQSYSQLTTLSGKKLNTDRLDKYIVKQMDSLQMPGLSFALINNGKVVYHKAIGKANTQTQEKINDQSLFEAASLSKTVFAYYVLKLVDEKLLDLDTPLYKYLPYKDIEKDERYKMITARMALSHTTGFPNWRYFDKRDENLYKYGELYLKFTPGTQFSYSGEGYHYLTQVVAHLKHLSITTLEPEFQKEVANPLRMNHSWFTGNKYITTHKVWGHVKGKTRERRWSGSFPEQDSTWFNTAGGLHTDALDYSSFLIGLMKGKGLSKGSFNEIFKEQVALSKDAPHYIYNHDTGWGLGIAIRPVSYGVIYEHGGNNTDFQSGFKINKANKSGYVLFTNSDQGIEFNQKMAELLLQ